MNMAISARQKQKKLEKKNKKRKNAKKVMANTLRLGKRAKSYRNHPIHECLIPDGLFDSGLGEVVVTRRLANGDIALSAFILDVYCLGVKNAMFKVTSEADYENVFKKGFIATHEDQKFETAHPSCAKKLIEGGVSYARKLGFSPHRDYYNAIQLLAEIDSNVCPVKYNYGKSGKPFYIQGPHETPDEIRSIMRKLHSKCGKGSYDYMVSVEEVDFEK